MSEELSPINVTPMVLLKNALDKGLDIDKLERLFELQERYEKQEAAKAYAAALTEFQAAMPIVHKRRTAKEDGNFKGYAYASYDDVWIVAGPICGRLGIVVKFDTEPDKFDTEVIAKDGQRTPVKMNAMKCTCTIRVGIHTETTTLSLPVPQIRAANDTQRSGGALSYLRRYTLCAALNIVCSDEDNDAHGLLDYIDDVEVKHLRELLKAFNRDEKRFCDFAKVPSLADITKADYPKWVQVIKNPPQTGGKK